MSKYNDIDLSNWKNYDDIFTDSLWIIDKRDKSGVHNASYHGNFIPQIPNQLFKRYTKKGDLILDPFSGSGTSLIEAQRLGRNFIGIELQKDVAQNSIELVKQEPNQGTSGVVIVGDSKNVNIENQLSKMGKKNVQFIIYHPPYWDIIKFSDLKNDLSNSETLDDFLNSFGEIIDNTVKYLEKGHYCAIVIGDKYANSQIVPLGFLCMNLFLEKGLLLKAIIIKNFEETKGKSNQHAIWRYRALASDFYIFKHEYIMIFKKVK